MSDAQTTLRNHARKRLRFGGRLILVSLAAAGCWGYTLDRYTPSDLEAQFVCYMPNYAGAIDIFTLSCAAAVWLGAVRDGVAIRYGLFWVTAGIWFAGMLVLKSGTAYWLRMPGTEIPAPTGLLNALALGAVLGSVVGIVHARLRSGKPSRRWLSLCELVLGSDEGPIWPPRRRKAQVNVPLRPPF